MSELGFEGRVVVITGAGGGLGRQHALMFAKRGARVVVNDLGGPVDGSGSGSAGPAQMVVDEITALGGEAVADTNSVATADGGAAIVHSAIEAFGQIDVVVNNAGILRDKSFANMTPELVDPVFDVHLKGAFNVTRAAWPHMKERNYGRIVCTSSAAGIFGNFGQTNYGAAKMGLVGFTNVLAVEGARNNIKANAIAPLAMTRMTENILGGLADQLGPEYVSPIVGWLGHEDCPVTGEIYSVGGGRVARVFIAESVGYYSRDLSMESVRDNWDQIRDEEGYSVPAHLGEETALYIKAFRG